MIFTKDKTVFVWEDEPLLCLFLYDGCSQLISQQHEGEVSLLSLGEITMLKIHTRLCHSPSSYLWTLCHSTMKYIWDNQRSNLDNESLRPARFREHLKQLINLKEAYCVCSVSAPVAVKTDAAWQLCCLFGSLNPFIVIRWHASLLATRESSLTKLTGPGPFTEGKARAGTQSPWT